MILGFDISGHQGVIDFAKAKAAGYSFVVVKATEGVGWTDPMFVANRRNAHAAGLIVGIYHFARPDTNNTAAAEAQSFLSAVGALQAGEFLVLDWERPCPTSPVAWCKAWLDTVAGATGVNPLIYMNQSTVAGSNWSPITANYGLWLARYDNSPSVFNSVPYWGQPAMKQYSDAGTVPGVSGTCDVDSFNGTSDQLLKYGYQGADMPLTRDDAQLVVSELLNTVLDARGGYGPGAFIDWIRDARAETGQVYGKVVADRYDLTNRPGADADDLLGQVLSTRAEVRALQQAQAPVIDEAKLAAALLADPANVDKLGAAIAAHLQLAPRTDAPTPPPAA